MYKYQITNKLDKKYYKDILKILTESDFEFIPPLSARNSSTDSNLNLGKNFIVREPIEYFESLKNQHFILVFSNNKIVGFLSYKPNYKISEIGITGYYVSTIIISKKYRNQNLAKTLYKELINNLQNKRIITRTWFSPISENSNDVHISILKQLGFKQFKCLKNDRGAEIDTLYFIL